MFSWWKNGSSWDLHVFKILNEKLQVFSKKGFQYFGKELSKNLWSEKTHPDLYFTLKNN